MFETDSFSIDKRDGYHLAHRVLVSRSEHSAAYDSSTGSPEADQYKKKSLGDLIQAITRLHDGASDVATELARLTESPEQTAALIKKMDDESCRDGRVYAYTAVQLLAAAMEMSAENILTLTRFEKSNGELQGFGRALHAAFSDIRKKVEHDISICMRVHLELQEIEFEKKLALPPVTVTIEDRPSALRRQQH